MGTRRLHHAPQASASALSLVWVVLLSWSCCCWSSAAHTNPAGACAFASNCETTRIRFGVSNNNDNILSVWLPSKSSSRITPTSSRLHALPPSWLPPPSQPPPEVAAAIVEQTNSAVDHPTWLSVLIPVAIAAVVTTIIYPDTSDKIREYWENQFEDANEGPLIVNDDESIDLVPKYGTTPVTNATKRALRVALGEEEISNDKAFDIVEPADKVQPGTIPSIPKKPSAEELTTLVGSVAAAVKNDGKDFDALLAERKQRAAEQSDVSNTSLPRQKKRDLVRKATKKLIMPWKKWESL